MAFSQKLLKFTFDLPGVDRFSLSGLRASVSIVQGGAGNYGQCEFSISGMTLSDMNKLSTLGIRINYVRKNIMTVEAGDTINGLSVVYQGVIMTGYADFGAMPNVSFRGLVNPGGYLAVQPIPPTTINGIADVATIMNGLANQANLHFKNFGVDQKLSHPYFPGTVLEQIQRCAEHANIEHTIDHVTGTLEIWPKGNARGDLIPIVSAETGMIGYPAFSQIGLEISSVFNPSLQYGQRIQVKSSLPAASNQWNIASLTHELESMVPGGQWHTHFIGAAPGVFVLAPNPGRG